MPAGNNPAYTIKARRKDGTDITYNDYTGAQVTKSMQPVASLFENRFGGLDVVWEKNVPPINPDEFYYNAFNNKQQTNSNSTARTGPTAQKAAATRAAAPGADPELQF